VSPEFLAWYATQYEPIEFDGLTLMRMKQSAWDGWQAARSPGDSLTLFSALPNVLAAIAATKTNTAQQGDGEFPPDSGRDAVLVATLKKIKHEAETGRIAYGVVALNEILRLASSALAAQLTENAAVQPLTDAEIDAIWGDQYEKYGQVCDSEDFRMFARAILVAASEKGGA